MKPGRVFLVKCFAIRPRAEGGFDVCRGTKRIAGRDADDAGAAALLMLRVALVPARGWKLHRVLVEETPIC